MIDKQLAPLVEEITQALDGKAEAQTVENELNRYLNEYNVPLREARRIVIKRLGGDPRDVSPAGVTITISEVRDGLFRVGTRAKVLSVEERTFSKDGEEKTFFSGILADTSGRVPFTAWFDFELKAGDVIRISNAYTKSWRGMPQLNLSENTDVKKIEDDGEFAEVEMQEPKKHFIEKFVEHGGAYDAVVEGVILEVKPRSGLIMRCPECNRALQKGACVVHGSTEEGVRDLRVKAVIDDGTGSATAILNREITEKLLGMTMDECTALAQERMDTEVVFDKIEEILVARPVRLQGNVLSDEYGLTVISRSFEIIEPGDTEANAKVFLETLGGEE